MLKLFGILIIITVSSLYGFRASSHLRERVKVLGKYVILIDEMEDNIRLKIGIEEMFSSEIIKEMLSYENYKVEFKKEGLNKNDIKLLDDFFAKIGFGDTTSQTELCKLYKELVGKKEKEAEQETQQKAKLYSVLGFSFGLFAAVLLI